MVGSKRKDGFWNSPQTIGFAATYDLLRYIKEDVSAIRDRMETGKYLDGIEYDAATPAELIESYAKELKRRGF